MNEKSNKGIIALLFVGVLMGALDISIVGPALPNIESTLQITSRFSGWIFSIYVLFNLIGISLFARLSDVFGRRKIYVIALSIFALGSLIVSLSENFTMLLIGRAIQGFGASGIFPVASALVGDLFPPEKRGRILGLIGAVFGIAFLIGPFIAGVLLHYLSWNFLFIINLPISAVLIYFSLKLLPSKPSVIIKKIDWGGIITLGIALAGFTYGINSFDVSNLDFNSFQFILILPFLISIIAIIVLFVIEHKTESPIIKFSFFRNSQIVIVGIISMFTGILQATFVYIPKFVILSMSVSVSTASFMLTPFVLATAIGSPVFGRMIDKYGVKKIVLIGLALCSVGFYILSISDGQPTFYYLSGALIGLGLSVLAGSSLRYIMLNNTEAEDRAISQGMLTIFISVGQLIGTAIIGLSLASLPNNNAFFVLFCGVSLLAILMFVTALGLKKNSLPKK